MNGIGTEIVLETQTAQTEWQRRNFSGVVEQGFTAKALFHGRALLRMARTRPRLAFAIALTTGSGISTAGALAIAAATQVAYQVELHATVPPLAPAPRPPAAPVLLLSKHIHQLPRLRVNPLAGLASWYGSVWNGRKTASGEDFDESQLTAAHKSLPLGTLVRVTNLRSMRSVIVRINDRGALAPNRVIDLSSAAAREIGILENGLAQVNLEILGRS